MRARIIDRTSGTAVGEVEAETTYGLWMALLDWGERQGVPRFTVPARYRTERLGETAEMPQPAPRPAPAGGGSRAPRRGRQVATAATDTRRVMETPAPVADDGPGESTPAETLATEPASGQADPVAPPPHGHADHRPAPGGAQSIAPVPGQPHGDAIHRAPIDAQPPIASSESEAPSGAVSDGEPGDRADAPAVPTSAPTVDDELPAGDGTGTTKRQRRRPPPVRDADETTTRPRRKAARDADGSAGATTSPAEQLRLF